jgi:hypothetical protein
MHFTSLEVGDQSESGAQESIGNQSGAQESIDLLITRLANY